MLLVPFPLAEFHQNPPKSLAYLLIVENIADSTLLNQVSTLPRARKCLEENDV